MSLDSNSLYPLFNPKSIAAIGASSQPNKIGGRIFRYTKDNGFAGKLYPINSNRSEVQGVPTIPSVADLPEGVDLAYVIVPAPYVVEAMEGLAAKRVKTAVIFSSGFAEMDADGEKAQQRIAAIARESGMRVVGPNCMGVINPRTGVVGTFARSFDDGLPDPGPIGFASQSGAFGSHGLYLALERGMSISLWCTTGNSVDVDVADCLEYMALDDNTKVILAYLEGARDKERLVHALALAQERGKPVVMLKVGRSAVGAIAASSHTASLVGSDAVYDAVFKEYGVHRVHTIDGLLDVAYACCGGVFPRSKRAGLLSISGGVAVLMADSASSLGLEVPELPASAQKKLKDLIPFSAVRNPVDMTAQATNDQLLVKDFMEVVLEQSDIDSMVCFLPAARTQRMLDELPGPMKALREKYPDKAMVLCTNETEELKRPYEDVGFLVYEDPTRALRAVFALTTFAQAFARVGKRLAPPALPAGAPPVPTETVSEYEAKVLLGRAGIPVVPERLATSAAEARTAAAELGFPVVMKVASPDILHKSEMGGVLLNIATAAAAEEAFATLTARARQAQPDARLDGILVAPMIAGGVETILGVQRDPVFGPVVMFGLGGIFVEVFHDVTLRVAPFGVDVAREMIEEVQGYALLKGARGRPPADIAALVNALAALSVYAAANADRLETLDLNPFIVRPEGEGAVAVDALIVPRQE